MANRRQAGGNCSSGIEQQKLNDDLKALLEVDRRATAEREANTESPAPVADVADVAEWECEVFVEDETPEVVTPEFTLPSQSVEAPGFEVTGRAARAVSPVEHDAQLVLDVTMDQAPPRIDPARFHEPSYRSTIRQLAVGHIGTCQRL